jgi:glutathione synthase/RimK-type ligase-like ATP-grasp enzyme
VTRWLPRLTQETRLRQVTDRLARQPDALDARFERASLLRALGQFEPAKQEYLDVLRRAPHHFGALNDLGTLLFERGFRSAARTAYRQAVLHHPANPIGHINLANLLLAAGELVAAQAHYEVALRIDPDDTHANRGIANLLAQAGDHAGAARHRDKTYRGKFITTLPYRGAQAPVPILLLVSASDGNIPTGQLLDDRVFLTSVLVAEYCDPAVPLPPHRLIFNSIGDADLCSDGLQAAATLVERTPVPVLNHPAAVRETGRRSNAARLGRLPDVIAPRIAAAPRRVLRGPQARAMIEGRGFAFPLLLRAPGFHTGRHFVRVDGPDDLAAAASSLPGDDVWIIQYLDARGRDGKARKYRVMIVDGKLYPLHVAVADHWKVHYFTADMNERPEHRGEDAAFLESMAGVLGPRAVRGLEQVRDALGLDYGGIDFAIGPAGEVILFEANATMTVNAPAPDPKWDYRRAPVDRVLRAVRTMLLERALGTAEGRTQAA